MALQHGGSSVRSPLQEHLTTLGMTLSEVIVATVSGRFDSYGMPLDSTKLASVVVADVGMPKKEVVGFP